MAQQTHDEASGQDSTTVAVAAHSLLQSISVILAAAEMIQTHGDQIDAERQNELLDLIGAQGRHVAGVLADLVRGVPTEVLAVLDQLQPTRSTTVNGLTMLPRKVDWK